MAELKALRSVLFESKLYFPGDSLPTKNEGMISAWIKAGTAVWSDGEKATAVKAKPAAAEAGLAGTAVSSESENGEDLIGKVPKTRTRSKAKKQQ